MDEINRSLSDYYTSGEYFADAKEWYSTKYLYPVSQRYFILMLASLLFIITSVLYSTIFAIMTKPTEYMYEVPVFDAIKYRADIEALDDAAPSEQSVAEYLAAKYVTKYESYSFADIPKQFEYIKNNSERDIMMNFYHKMDLSNDNSPILLYQKYTDITISDIKVSFEDLHDIDNIYAKVTFVRNLNNKISGKLDKENQSVYIKFALSNVENDDFQQNPLIFRVKEYNVIKD